ncbi:MAG: hypothetical protein ACD_3C00088G0004 [uncultured bacterium (gcode 4)]|uniref:Uncharacterized protein n=1 Tax=uncultured bacterium (gcode 4) TaxID=1234023 RepID=K2FZ06_9BACT|nr:MAG: hypothetical protein ACD_3C00088G0004 [uncultured bacterium (gcode 4)]
MGLDSMEDIEVGEWWWEKAQETAKEAQEKKEKASKAMAWIQRTRKDEKKATKDNDFLYEIIVDIIRNREYDILLPFVSDMLKQWVSSNFILWGISLVYDEAVYIIRTNYLPWNTKITVDKELAKAFKLTLWYTPTQQVVEFNDNNINSAIKSRINEWIEDIISIISFDPSTIITKKFLSLLQSSDNKNLLINYIASILTFFLFRLNIFITKEKAFLYSEFILWETVKKLRSLHLEEIES